MIKVLEVLLGVGLGLLLASNVALWLKLNRCYWDLHKIISESTEGIEFEPNVEGIKDEIFDAIGEFMGDLKVPTAQDHFIGGLSQIMQMWAMKKFSPMVEQMQNQIADPGQGQPIQDLP